MGDAVGAEPADDDPARPRLPWRADRPRRPPADSDSSPVTVAARDRLDQVARPQGALDILEQLPSSSCRPNRVPLCAASTAAMKSSGRCGLARVAPPVSTVPSSASRRFSTGTGRGVVVTSARGFAPRRSPSRRLSQAACAAAPFGELVAPGEMMLGPAQALRIGGRIDEGLGAAGEGQPPPARLPAHLSRSVVPGDREQARIGPRPSPPAPPPDWRRPGRSPRPDWPWRRPTPIPPPPGSCRSRARPAAPRPASRPAAASGPHAPSSASRPRGPGARPRSATGSPAGFRPRPAPPAPRPPAGRRDSLIASTLSRVAGALPAGRGQARTAPG